MNEILQDALTDGFANLLFGLVLCFVFAVLFSTVVFSCLALRVVWKWFTGESVNSVIVKSERKAFR